MPDDSTLVGPELGALVRRLVAETLVVPVEQVHDDTALMAQLGAESLDFLDLLFRIEETLGLEIPQARWHDFVADYCDGLAPESALTPRAVVEFVTRMRSERHAH